jgi:multidrug efflux pump subunit AcrA (membrane-fusion protein)
MKSKLHPFLSVLILSSLMLAACSALPGGAGAPTPTPIPVVVSDSQIVSEGSIIPKENKDLAFFGNGQVDEVLVNEGDLVKKNMVVARLGNREQLEAAIAGAESELISAKQARKQLDDNLSLAQADATAAMAAANKTLKDAQYQIDNFSVPTNMEGLTPLDAVAKMKSLLDVARDKFEPYKYYSENDTTRKDLKKKLDNAQSDYNTAVRWLQLETNLTAADTRLDETMKDYEKLLKGPDPDQVATADARIKAAEANLAAAKANLDNLELKATIDGTVVKNDLVVGQNVAAGVPVMTVADFSELFAETDDLTEIEVVDVAIGQEVTVVADALPDVKLKGVVEKISQISEEKRGDITYTVRVKLMETDPRLRWGMTVVITFLKP